MKSACVLFCAVFLLAACNPYGVNSQSQYSRSTGAQNQYVPVIISDDEGSNSIPAVTLCTREPYASYSNTPDHCNSAPIILP
ncbi:hypothetical protein CBF23_004470 [Marinomonas agarivorans]|nr:hypothetical protein CBF23_004470 [Marinomonas agarivorans]